MNVAPGPYPGARVQVTWSDGRAYPATVIAVGNGFVHVQWDSGGAPQWVPLGVVAPLAAYPPSHAAPPHAAPPHAAPPHAAPPHAAPPHAAPPHAAPPHGGHAAYPYAQHAPPQHAAARQAPSPYAPPQHAPPPHAPPQHAPPQHAPPSQHVAHAATVVHAAPSAASGSGPRPTAATIRDLPRGLVYEPTGSGVGNGKAFFVLFGFVATTDADAAMRATDIDHIGDDVAALRAVGYRVIVDLHGDLELLDSVLLGKHPDAGGAVTAGVFWGGHGDADGTIGTFDGGWIAPEDLDAEVAKKGTVKLFVMSACHAGNHVPRWQKALGAQAQIIGWGAPITNARAIEFLVPDEANAKGFDDLLIKHLGAPPVTGDGPLVEVRELAKKHEERVATMLLGLDELVKEATKRLRCKCERIKNTDVYVMEVRTPPSKDNPDKPRSQLVRVTTMGAGDAFVHIMSRVGAYSDALDLARALRATAPAIHIRVAIAKLNADDSEQIIVETIVRRRRLDPYTFSNNVSTVGMYADKLEDMYFGSDVR
jgi:hypothetical protein